MNKPKRIDFDKVDINAYIDRLPINKEDYDINYDEETRILHINSKNKKEINDTVEFCSSKYDSDEINKCALLLSERHKIFVSEMKGE